jgi:hypothetical protein
MRALLGDASHDNGTIIAAACKPGSVVGGFCRHPRDKMMLL